MESPSGFTLLELVVVIAALAVLALLVVPMLDHTKDTAAVDATRTALDAVRNAIVSPDGKSGYRQHLGSLPQTLSELYLPPAGADAYDPSTRRGWNGPYLRAGATVVNSQNETAPADAWGRPIVLQYPTGFATPEERSEFARLVSAGPDGVVQTPASVLFPAPSERGDDLVVFVLRPDMAP